MFSYTDEELLFSPQNLLERAKFKKKLLLLNGFGVISLKRRHSKIIVASIFVILFTAAMPQAYASIVENPGAVQLIANTQVKINGPVSTYPTDTIDRAE